MIPLFHRQWEVKNHRRREKLLRAYIQLQIYNRILNEWIQDVTTPAFFGVGGVVVLFLYIPLAHSESLPTLCNAALGYMAVALVAILMRLTTDSLGVTRATESVISSLQSVPTVQRQLMGLEQVESLKRAKALRPVTHPIGSFGSLTLSVPVVFMEEILNQLLFLLTL